METRSDFLTGQMTFTLLYEDKHKELKLIGRSQQVGALNDIGGSQRGQYVQRLKLLDFEGDLADDIDLSGAILRLRLPAAALLLQETLKEKGHVARGHETCHNFELSVRCEARNGENEAGE